MFNIAVDGTSASGKSTVCKLVAKELGILHLNTGALYRSMAKFFLDNNLKSTDSNDVEYAINNCNISIKFENNSQKTLINGEDISDSLSQNNISEFSAIISQIPAVRQKIKLLQQDIAKSFNVLIEGRDICSEILPNSKYKFFITASLEERAKRRFNQLKQLDSNVTYESILNSLKLRDFQDTHRAICPLKQVEDAILIDTTSLSIEQVVKKILDFINDEDKKCITY